MTCLRGRQWLRRVHMQDGNNSIRTRADARRELHGLARNTRRSPGRSHHHFLRLRHHGCEIVYYSESRIKIDMCSIYAKHPQLCDGYLSLISHGTTSVHCLPMVDLNAGHTLFDSLAIGGRKSKGSCDVRPVLKLSNVSKASTEQDAERAPSAVYRACKLHRVVLPSCQT
jgi:hypothetical protein